MVRCLAVAILDESKHLAILRVAPEGTLGENQIPVDRHFEDAAGTLDEGYLGIWILFFNAGRQTGSPGFVVSDYAVLDAYFHRNLRPELVDGNL